MFSPPSDLESRPGRRGGIGGTDNTRGQGARAVRRTVTRTTSFGAFVEILPGKEGLTHISKLPTVTYLRVEEYQCRDKVKVEVTGSTRWEG